MQRGLRFNKGSPALWAAYVDLELQCLLLVMKHRAALGLPLTGDDLPAPKAAATDGFHADADADDGESGDVVQATEAALASETAAAGAGAGAAGAGVAAAAVGAAAGAAGAGKKRRKGAGGEEEDPEAVRRRAMAAFLSGAVVDVVVRHARAALPGNPAFLLSLVAVVDAVAAGRRAVASVGAGSASRAGAAAEVGKQVATAAGPTLLAIADRILRDVQAQFPSVCVPGRGARGLVVGRGGSGRGGVCVWGGGARRAGRAGGCEGRRG
jgi:hypothetical protein